MKEMLHFLQIMLREVRNVEILVVVRVVARHCQNLVVGLPAIEHLEDAERPAIDLTTRKRGLVDADENVQRIPVLMQSARDETVVAGIVHGTEQDAVELEHPAHLVELVLVSAARRDLDDRGDLLGRVGSYGQIVPQVEHYAPPELRRKAVVHGHCHHKAIMKMTAEQALLPKLGLDFQVLDSGCCGMAGAFGFEKDHYTVSIKAGERVLLPAVRKADKEMLIIADGFSARTGRLWIEEGKATMAVKMPIDLAQNGSTRQALQQVKVQGDRWHLSVPPTPLARGYCFAVRQDERSRHQSVLPTPLARGYRFAVRQDERQAPPPRVHRSPRPYWL